MKRISKRKNSIFLKLWIGGIILFLSFLTFIFFKSGLFNIKKVEIDGKDLGCVDVNQLVDSSQIKGSNLYLYNSVSLIRNIKENFICIKSVSLSKLFPNHIKIKITGRVPIAKLIILKDSEASSSSIIENIATPSASQSAGDFLIDDEGVIFSKDTSRVNVPTIFLYNLNLFLGKSLGSDNAKNALKIFEKVEKFGLSIDSAVIVNENFIIFSSPKLVFKLDSDINIQIASLQLILEKAKIDEGSIEFIDLRFDKPVIRFTPKKNG